MKITTEMVHTAYAIAKLAYEGKYTVNEAKEEIYRITGMNPNSACDYVNNFRYMVDGERYVRVMSLYATKYFVERIRADYGETAFLSALESNRKHIAYYKPHGKRNCIEKMIQVFENQ